jgi:hypothetical protein
MVVVVVALAVVVVVARAVVRAEMVAVVVCEHIGDTSIRVQERISMFNFPERFLEISCRDLIDLTFQHF